MTVAWQRFGKHRLKTGITMNRSGSPLIGNGAANTFSVTTDRMTTNCSRWWSPFDSPEVIKRRTRENARRVFVKQSSFKAVAVERRTKS
jgi:hypothetical protein